MTVFVSSADVQDRDGAVQLIEQTKTILSRLRLIWADSAYAGAFVGWCQSAIRVTVEIVRRKEKKAFVVQPKRWIVERTFAWISRFRRLAKDYETLPQTSEQMILLAMIHIMVRRLK